jgi:hypothetical protein
MQCTYSNAYDWNIIGCGPKRAEAGEGRSTGPEIEWPHKETLNGAGNGPAVDWSVLSSRRISKLSRHWLWKPQAWTG